MTTSDFGPPPKDDDMGVDGVPIQVQIVAAGADGEPNGEQVTLFNLKASTHFSKLMSLWCSYNGVPQVSALFQFEEKD